jgi:hypothetical protein
VANNGGLLGIDPGLLTSVGLGLIAGSQYGHNPGAEVQNALGNYQQRRYTQQQSQLAQQQYGMNQYQLNMMKAQAPFIMQALQGAVGSTQGQQAPQSPQNAPAQGAPVVGPYSAMPAQQPAPQSQQEPQQAPQQPTGNDPWSLIQRGTALQAVPMLAGYGKAMVAQGQAMLQNDPRYVTQRAVAANTLTQDQAALSNTQPGSLAYRAAQMKYLKDSGLVTQSSMNGAVQTFGGITPAMLGMSTTNPIQGVQTQNGIESPIPGATATQQALAGAKARGEAQGDVEEVTDGSGNRYYVPRSALLGSGAGAGNSGPTPFQASVGPATAELLKGKGEQAVETNKDYQSQAEAGQQMLAQITQLKGAAKDFTPGQFADSRIKGLQWMQSLGLITPQEQQRLGSAQEGTKIAIQLQAAATKQLGSREAAQIFQIMGKSLPNLTLSPNGLSKVSSYMAGISRYNIARAQIAQQSVDSNDVNGVNDVRDNFIKNTNPTYYIIASAPPAIQKEMISSMGSKGRQCGVGSASLTVCE